MLPRSCFVKAAWHCFDSMSAFPLPDYQNCLLMMECQQNPFQDLLCMTRISLVVLSLLSTASNILSIQLLYASVSCFLTHV